MSAIGVFARCLGRLVAVSGMVAALALVEPVGASLPTALLQTAPAAPTGELLYLNRGDIWRLDFATSVQQLVVHPSEGIVTRLAHSPDRGRLAYSVLRIDQMYHILGGDIVVSNPDGSSPQTVVHEDEAGYAVGWVSWSNDPAKLVYEKENVSRGIQRVEEVDLRTGERTLVVDGGSSPAASPTDPTLTYETRADQESLDGDSTAPSPVTRAMTGAGTRSVMWRLDRRTGMTTEVVRPEWFDDADNPTYSPDGSTIAFIAAGSGPSSRQAAPDLAEWILKLGRAHVADAHDMPGVFFDVWFMSASGETPRKLTPLADMQPEIAWSPDGRSIAAMGAFQLQIVDVATGARTSIPRPNSSSQLSWGNANH